MKRITSVPRIGAWMLGYYAAQIEQKKALSDIPLSRMSQEYIRELGKRADKETKHLSTGYIRNTHVN